MEPRFGGICGITADKLSGLLTPDVERLAGSLGLSPASSADALKRIYDGHRFSEHEAEIYNPFSLMTAFDRQRLGAFWFNSGTLTSLIALLKQDNVTIPELEGTEASEASFDAPTESMEDPVTFMYQSGNLTIKSYDPLVRTYVHSPTRRLASMS